MAAAAGWVAALSLSISAGSGDEGDWPQWRGPEGSGISNERDWLAESQAEPLWSANVGRGYSNVCILGERLFTLGYDEEAELDVVLCLQAETGERLWDFAYGSKLWDNMHEGGTLTTPVAEGNRVFLLSRMGPLYCLAADSGEILWERDAVEEFGIALGGFGLAASPLILDEMLVVNVGKTLALDKATGKTLWATEDYGYAYAVPATMEREGRQLLVVPNDVGYVVLERKTGAEVARHAVESVYHTNVATPIVIGQRFFVSTGFDGGSCSLLELGKDGLRAVWSNKRMLNKMTGCVLVGDHLFGFDDAVLKCLDLEGEEKWRERGLGTGALSASADGRLIVLSEEGELLIAPARASGFEPIARTQVFEEGVCWTSPVLSKGRLYLRNNRGELVARDHRARQ